MLCFKQGPHNLTATLWHLLSTFKVDINTIYPLISMLRQAGPSLTSPMQNIRRIKNVCDCLGPSSVFRCVCVINARPQRVMSSGRICPLVTSERFLWCFFIRRFLLVSLAPGVPSQSSADASRSPPAKSMLLKLSTQKSSQHEVSAADIHRGCSRGSNVNLCKVKADNGGLLELLGGMWLSLQVLSASFLKSGDPGTIHSWKAAGPLGRSRAAAVRVVQRGFSEGFGVGLQPFLVCYGYSGSLADDCVCTSLTLILKYPQVLTAAQRMG